jgi:hypothetical protein
MNVSIQDMQSVASGSGFNQGQSINISQEIGNVIEVTELTDDLGLNLLANQAKSKPDGAQGFGSAPIRLSVPDEPTKSIQFDTLEPIDLNSFGGFNDLHSSSAPALPQVTVSRDQGFNTQSSSSGRSISLTPAPPRDLEKERQEKIEYLNKLQRLESKGYPVSKRFTMDNSFEEIKQEYTRLVDARNLEGSLRFQRQMLMGAITGIEWMNGKFDPFDLKLDGWSESVHENVEDFDEIFEELYDKYKDKGKMSPEMRLVMAVGGSGFMCHVSNTFFRSKMPSMDDVLRKNPDLARQMAAAAAQQAGPGFGNFMGMAMGVPEPPPGVTPPGMGPFQPPPPPPTGAFFAASEARMPQSQVQAQAQKPTARREMSGPSGVEDILKTFEEVRKAENQPLPVYTSNQPAVQATMSGGASVMTDDMSYSESINTGSGSAGRRRRRAAPPSGSTISLNV